MTLITQIFHSSILFWAAWVIIPIVMEIIPTIGNFFHTDKEETGVEEGEGDQLFSGDNTYHTCV